MTVFEWIASILAFLSVLGVAPGIFYTGRQIQLAARIHWENHDWNRRKAAQDALQLLADMIPEARRLNAEVRYVDAVAPLPVEDIESAFAREPDYDWYVTDF